MQAFDAWLVAEHKRHKIDEKHLNRTFYLCSVGNGKIWFVRSGSHMIRKCSVVKYLYANEGIVAVIAGSAAQYMASTFGEIGYSCIKLLVVLGGIDGANLICLPNSLAHSSWQSRLQLLRAR